MKIISHPLAKLSVIGSSVLLIMTAASVLANQDLINTKSSWPANSAWIEIPKLRDGADTTGQNTWDFTTNSAGQGTVYWCDDGSFLYFRVRLNQANITWNNTTKGAVRIYLKKAGSAKLVDFAFAWDAANYANFPQHGLEMQLFSSSTSSYWENLTMDDVDTNPNQKTIADLNYSTYTDAYLRVADGLTGSDAGTCYLDWAISWSYLGDTVRHSAFNLYRTDTWYVAVGGQNTGNDHGALGSYPATDLAGINDSAYAVHSCAS